MHSKMIEPEKTLDAYKEWALHELKDVGRRNFEMSKYLFGISAGSFAIFSFLGEQVAFSNYFQILGLIFLAGSAVVSILLVEPADFRINGDENLPVEHSEFAAKGKALRHFWLVLWLLGVVLVVITSEGGATDDSSISIEIKRNG